MPMINLIVVEFSVMTKQWISLLAAFLAVGLVLMLVVMALDVVERSEYDIPVK